MNRARSGGESVTVACSSVGSALVAPVRPSGDEQEADGEGGERPQVGQRTTTIGCAEDTEG
jgi:hypothetical protein